MAGILAFARARDITSASFQAIGAFKTAVLGFFDFDRRAYDRIPVDGQAEVVSLTGNIAREGEEPRLHAPAVLGARERAVWGKGVSVRVDIVGVRFLKKKKQKK